MSHKRKSSRAVHTSSPAVANDQRYSGISAPAVQLLQDTADEEHSTEKKNDYSRTDIRPFQLKPGNAVAQGTDTQMAPRQEHRLPHEAWYVVQRKPVEDGRNYKDNKYPDVRLEKLKTSVYKILNDGAYKDRVIVFDVDEEAYYDKDPEGDYANFDSPFDIGQVSSGPSAAVEVQTRYDNIGETGKGVANVSAETTLRTTGLNTCVGWLLYNDTAAYLTHIVVDNPGKVKANGGIHNQVQAIVSQFTEIAGAPPTHLKIHVDAEQPSYQNTLVWQSGWMLELVPPSCTVGWTRGPGVLAHVVPAKGGNRKEWSGAPIVLSYEN